jgi:carboxylate-amine ligase
MTELIELTGEDADALGCRADLERVLTITASGTSAERQRAVLGQAIAQGADREAAMLQVVDHLIEEFHRDL